VKRRYETLESLAALAAAAGSFALFLRLVWSALGWLNYRPRPIIELPIRHLGPIVGPHSGRALKVLTYNVQFFAGTKYRFFYDGGPDTQVNAADIWTIMQQIGDLLRAERPDFILLQELDCAARRTCGLDELAEVIRSLPDEYTSVVSTYYWRSRFVPHPKIWGSAGMQLATVSRWPIISANRRQLALKSQNFLVQDFDIKRAILEAQVNRGGGSCITVLNTHLEAFPGKTNVMSRQIAQVRERLAALDREGAPWILGGDFNLSPDDPENLIAQIFGSYEGVPTWSDTHREGRSHFFTYTKPNTDGRKPVRTLDYLFWSAGVRLNAYRVIPAYELSDHLPVVAELEIMER
jgi:endonuclease/exonuclease/phosphatase family metal-dependent hydrolase